ncbi:MAG: hypothetical protein NT026_00040 [Candidatus Staskawiczbacteria bacterium]|nr:hypothetical protein [Candidatus Staskawiczbacteria bacterium]
MSHYVIKCSADDLYWYDTLGAKTGLYRSCADANSCTQDTCGAAKCSNTLKCDGSTCVAGSPDYNTYCSQGNNNNNQPQNTNNVSISFFAKQDEGSMQWQKTVQLNANGKVYFMISVVDNSSAQADNVTVSANIPQEVSSLGNLQINGIPLTGDIVSGVNIGSIAVGTSKQLTFEGKAQSFSNQGTKQATATVGSQSDSLSINLTGQQAAAAVSGAQTTTGFWAFLKRWYLWILVGLVLLFLFVVVFRRLSSNA